MAKVTEAQVRKGIIDQLTSDPDISDEYLFYKIDYKLRVGRGAIHDSLINMMGDGTLRMGANFATIVD